MKRAIASALAAIMLVLSPGTGCWQAMAQVVTRTGPAAAPARVVVGAPGALGASPTLSAPTLSAPSLSVTLPSPAAPTARGAASASAAAAQSAVPAGLPAPARAAGTVSASAAAPAARAAAQTQGREAVSAGLKNTVKAAAPMLEAAKSGSGGDAHRAGIQLEELLSGAPRRAASDAVTPAPASRLPSFTGRARLGSARVIGAAPSAVMNAVAAPAAPRPSLASRFSASFRRAFLFIRKTAAVATLAAFLPVFGMFGGTPFQILPPVTVQAQLPGQVPGAQVPVAPPQAGVPQAQVPTAQAPVVQASPIEVSVPQTVQGRTVGESVTYSVTLRNTSNAPVTVSSVRTAVEEALPWTLEVTGDADAAPLTLAPGESKTLTFTLLPFDSGKLVLEGAELTIPTSDPEKPIVVKIPSTTFEVASVLTPDWKEKGFKDLAELRRGETPSLLWLLAVPVALLAIAGAERLLASRRRGSEPVVHNGPALDAARTRRARLEEGAASMDARQFYGETLTLVDRLLSDLRGMPRRERAPAQLLKEAAEKYSSGQLSVARRTLETAEAALHGGRADSPEARRQVLVALRELLADLSDQPRPEAPKAGLAGLAALLGTATVSFAHPWALLLLLPIAGWALHKWRQSRTEGWATTAPIPAQTGWKARLRWVPGLLRSSAIALTMLALAGPQLGVKRTETYIPSSDTVIAGDVSGSMSGARLDGLKRAVKDYLVEQRRGSNNRVGLTTFSDEPYLAVSLTTDYDALISRIKETETEGSTAVGKAMLSSISHFLELNIMQLDQSDARVVEMRKMVLGEDLSGALEFAKRHPDLLQKVLQPDHTKILVVFTDGESNTGIDPVAAAKIAKQLGIKVYTVGIQIGSGEQALKDVAQITGGIYFRAEDADGMRNALLDISRLEKSPSLVRSQVAVKDLTTLLALLALLSVTLEVGLSSTKLRTLPAFILAGLMGFSAVQGPAPQPQGAAPQAQASVDAPRGIIERLPLSGVPQEMAEGNALYLQGRYADAVKRYGQALESHPDVPALYFNLGNAYLRLGDVERAARAYGRFLELEKDPKAASEAIYNLANGALMKQDAEKAIELYREALRRDPSNASAKWNLEVVMRLMEEQQKQQGQDGKQQQKQKKGKKGQKGQKGQQGQQQGQKGDQQGEPGDQDGEPGDQQGKPGDKQGKPGDKPGSDAKPSQGERDKGVDGLIQEQGKAEQDGKNGQRGAVPRKGSGVWGFSLAGLGAAAAGFQAPLWLGVALVAVPLVAALVAYAVRKKISAAKSLAPREAPKRFADWAGKRRWTAKLMLLLASVLGLAITAGDPVWGTRDARLNFGGKDVIVAADVSASTLYAEDGRGARIEGELSEFVTRMQGTDRIGLVVFAGKARTASPLSSDYGTFEFKVGRLEREARGLSSGSDLSSAIEHAAKVFNGAKKVGDRQRILIVVSDGEIFDKDLSKAIDAARKAGITIYAIGVGDAGGTRIALPKADGSGSEYLIDEKTGQPAMTRLNEETLRQLASATGGYYFRSSEKASMGGILGKVAAMSQGSETDAIKTPRGIGYVFLTPALLLLLLEAFLPAVPLLRGRRVKAAPAAAPSAPAKTLNGGALLGLAAIPLGLWPQVLPFAALTAVLAGVLLYDISTRGALTRAARAWLGRKAPAEGLQKDLFALFDRPGDTRERWRTTDHAAVSSFVEGWRASSSETRRVLARKAAADPELWREKLVAALLAESAWPAKRGSDEALDAVLSALNTAKRGSLLPLEPIVLGVLDRRAELPWLSHPAVLRPLSRLAAAELDDSAPASRAALQSLASEADGAVASAAREALGDQAPAFKPTRARRIARSGALVFLAAMMGLTGLAGYKTVEFDAARRQAAETALSIFYGEDLFIFTDAYSDERIPREVLPVLKEWHATGKAAASDLAKALEVLRSSPDPKADNILEAVFKRADLMPLTDASENLLLKTLIERDNEPVWRFLNEYMASNGENEKATARLIKMIRIGAELGSEDVFQNTFHFLKSPNQTVRQEAAQAIRASLQAPERAGQLAARLKAVTEKHPEDPTINMWVAFFTLDRLAAADANTIDLGPLDDLLTVALKNAAKGDAARAALIAQVKPGEEDKLPPPALVQAFGLMERSLDRAAGLGANTDPLSLAARKQADVATKNIIVEGRAVFPELKLQLQNNGVMLPDPAPQPSSQGPEDSYDDYHGHGGYGGSYVNPDAVYRPTYTQQHLKALAQAVADARDAAGEKLTPQQREFADRALKSIEAMLSAGAKAGMPEGGTAAEAAADDVNSVLVEGTQKLPGSAFLAELRAAKLAPDAKVGNEKSRAYRQSYAAEDLLKIRAFLIDLLSRGTAAEGGKSSALNWSQKQFLADAITRLDAAIAKHYPAAAALIPADPSAAPLAAFTAAAKAGDEAALTKALTELKAVYDAAPVKDVVLARFKAAYPQSAVGYNDSVRMPVLRFWLDRLAEADGAKLDREGVLEILKAVSPDKMEAGKALAAYDALAKALQASATPAPALVEFAQEQVRLGAKRAYDGAKDALDAKAFAALQNTLRAERLLTKDLAMREVVKPVHLRALEASLKASKKAPAWTVSTVAKLQALTKAAGVPDGGTTAERAADAVNEMLGKGDNAFPSAAWYDALRAEGLAPAGSARGWERALAQSYTPDQLRALNAFINRTLSSGQGWDYSGKPSELTPAQGKALAEMAEALDSALAQFYPDQAALQPAALGRLVANGDHAAASARLAAAGSPAEALAILDAAAERSAGSAEAQKLAARLLAEALSGKNGPGLLEKEESLGFLHELGERLGAREGEALGQLSSALRAAPNPTLKAFIAAAVDARAEELADSIKGAPGAEQALIEAGVVTKRGYSSDTRSSFTQRHLRGLQAEAARLASVKGLTEEQSSAVDKAQKLLPDLLKAAVDAGVPTGTAPGDIAAERLSDIVYEGHMLFPGSRFVDELRAAKLLPPKSGSNAVDDKDMPKTWSKAEVAALRGFLQGVLSSGQGWDQGTGTRELTKEEKAYLENTLKSLDSLISNYDAPKPAAKSLHGGAFGLLAVGAVGLGSTPAAAASGLLLPVLALAAAAFAVYAGWLIFKDRAPQQAPAAPRLGPSQEVLARYKKLDLAAKKLAASLTEGKFRSRLVGPSGLSFAELAAYQGEDIKSINWKASAKSDDLLVNRYEQDKDMPLMLLIDLSASGDFAAGGTEKRRVIEDAAALLALTAARRNIRVGALLFTDRIEAFIPPAGGQRHAWELARQVIDKAPQGSKTDLKLALDFANTRFRSRAMVVLLSDLLGEGWESSLTAVAKRHDFRAVRVADPAEVKPLPDAGLVLMRDAEAGSQGWADTSSRSYREAAGQAVKGRERRIAAALEAARTRALTLYTDQDPIEELSRRFLAKKAGARD
ncbi:MAG: VWA domain-containing protein [Elusimicrobia bacterium]|nr:VWA domain-containing protein [Elusimicrobiota bacterium]